MCVNQFLKRVQEMQYKSACTVKYFPLFPHTSLMKFSELKLTIILTIYSLFFVVSDNGFSIVNEFEIYNFSYFVENNNLENSLFKKILVMSFL